MASKIIIVNNDNDNKYVLEPNKQLLVYNELIWIYK